MAHPVTAVRIDPKVKEQARAVLEREGVSLSSTVEGYLEEIARSSSIPNHAGKTDFVGLYLTPIMNDRYELPRRMTSPIWLRRRLAAQRRLIFGEDEA